MKYNHKFFKMSFRGTCSPSPHSKLGMFLITMLRLAPSTTPPTSPHHYPTLSHTQTHTHTHAHIQPAVIITNNVSIKLT